MNGRYVVYALLGLGLVLALVWYIFMRPEIVKMQETNPIPKSQSIQSVRSVL